MAGGGPAGRALAGACAAAGLRTALADPAPDRPWRATYAAWAGELPVGLPERVVAARARGRAVALTPHDLGHDYAVLDTAALREHLDAGLADVAVHRARVVRGAPSAGAGAPRRTVPAGSPDHLLDPLTGASRPAEARIVVDATGAPDPRPGRAPAEQTAYGLVLDAAAAAPLVGPGEALFMDWRQDHGRPGWPSFLYAVPLGGGAVLAEETSLARRPGLPLPELRARLLARLAAQGIAAPTGAREEKVRFPVDAPRSAGTAFGAAAPLVHPATGFSVATALALAPRLATALTGPDPQRAARELLWPAPAVAVHALRHRGLEALLRMPPARVPEFFEAFLGLPEQHRRAYLTGRADLPGTLRAMAALYARTGWAMRARLVGPALLPPAGPATAG